MKNIFAYTPPTPGAGLVPYISINDAGSGHARFIVRRSGDGVHADIELPEEELERLASALVRHIAGRRATDMSLATGGIHPGGVYVVGEAA